MSQPPVELPPHRIAIVIDGAVQDIIRTPDRLAALLLSEPSFVDISDSKYDEVALNTPYNSETKTFS